MVSESVTSWARKRSFPPGWPQNVEGNACRSLPHRVPCADLTKNWQELWKLQSAAPKPEEASLLDCTKPPGRGPVSLRTCCFPGAPRPPPPQTFPSRPPPLHTRTCRPPNSAVRPPHPRHGAGTLRSSPAGGPASAPCPALAASRTRGGRGFLDSRATAP